jgi:hypothetical protein
MADRCPACGSGALHYYEYQSSVPGVEESTTVGVCSDADCDVVSFQVDAEVSD